MANPIKFPYAKPIYAGAVAFLTGLITATADDTVTGNEWLVVALGTVTAVGAVLGVTGTEPKVGPQRAARARGRRTVE